jgi:hypothetical protein
MPDGPFCVAVGTTGPTFAPGSALVQRWNGSSWVMAPIPPPPGARSAELRDVSCHSRRSCLAMGTAGTLANTSAAFAEHWDGSRWTVLAPATPPGALGTQLHGVSCPQRRTCVAVGTAYFPGPGRFALARPLIERWTGSGWAVEPTSDLGSSNVSLDDVSCSAGDACTAVGYYDKTGTGQVPLVERWDGAAWRIQDTPAIPDQVHNQFSGVSCPRRRFCEAVGYVTTSTTTHGIAER